MKVDEIIYQTTYRSTHPLLFLRYKTNLNFVTNERNTRYILYRINSLIIYHQSATYLSNKIHKNGPVDDLLKFIIKTTKRQGKQFDIW